MTPTNTQLKALIKEIQMKTDQLKNISTTITAITDIVTVVTNILSLKILEGVAPTTAVAD